METPLYTVDAELATEPAETCATPAVTAPARVLKLLAAADAESSVAAPVGKAELEITTAPVSHAVKFSAIAVTLVSVDSAAP